MVLGLQFGGALGGLMTDLAGKAAALAALAAAQFGPLVALIPAGFLVTAVRRPRYALLTATWLVMTCWFAVSYTNADIERYYLGADPHRGELARDRPLMAWSRRWRHGCSSSRMPGDGGVRHGAGSPRRSSAVRSSRRR